MIFSIIAVVPLVSSCMLPSIAASRTSVAPPLALATPGQPICTLPFRDMSIGCTRPEMLLDLLPLRSTKLSAVRWRWSSSALISHSWPDSIASRITRPDRPDRPDRAARAPPLCERGLSAVTAFGSAPAENKCFFGSFNSACSFLLNVAASSIASCSALCILSSTIFSNSSSLLAFVDLFAIKLARPSWSTETSTDFSTIADLIASLIAFS
mmetsp:Transcript_12094/g.32707  ORF Transcript_12094/g.32707 Transcript_12094/m.32707 type:complete len:211 (+) Transcript_12094:564-1196(+)